MRISTNPAAISVYKGVRQSTESLYSSMGKLSSGQRIQRPGDAPADLGISQMFRYQIRNSMEAKRNVENARAMLSSADEWMQTVNNILSRMSELSVSAGDASKSTSDRANLEEEYQQLKEEVGRIARQSKYNGIQVVGGDQLVTYDQDKETFVFSQLDGKERYAMPVKVLDGLNSKNNQDFQFDSSKAFTQSHDGRYLFYADSSNNLVKYDIEENALFRDSSNSEEKGFDVDELGRLWVAKETSTGSGTYQLTQQDITSWVADQNLVAVGDIADIASTEFRIYDNRAYYLSTSGDIISRSITDHADVKIELASGDLPFVSTKGKFAMSHDGLYMADVPSGGEIRVTNMETKKSQTFTVGAGITVDNLSFAADNQELMYIDTNEDAIHRVKMTPGDAPSIHEDDKIHSPSGPNGFVGLSLDGGSHRSHFRIHNGPDAIQESFITTGDVRLVNLGISRTSIATIEGAQHALDKVQRAIDRVSVQRAKIGAEASRIDHSYEALVSYTDSIEQADSVLRDTDVVRESARMMQLKVQNEAALAMMAQANSIPQNALRLLQR